MIRIFLLGVSSLGYVEEQLAALSAKSQFKTFGIDSSEFGDGKEQSLRREGRGQGADCSLPKSVGIYSILQMWKLRQGIEWNRT